MAHLKAAMPDHNCKRFLLDGKDVGDRVVRPRICGIACGRRLVEGVPLHANLQLCWPEPCEAIAEYWGSTLDEHGFRCQALEKTRIAPVHGEVWGWVGLHLPSPKRKVERYHGLIAVVLRAGVVQNRFCQKITFSTGAELCDCQWRVGDRWFACSVGCSLRLG